MYENPPILYYHTPVSISFFGAGVCTLLSVHSVRYRVTPEQLVSSTVDSCSVPGPALPYSTLPRGHRLLSSLVRALEATGYSFDSPSESDAREWIVEDFISPGLELLLSLIGRISDQGVATESSYQLASLLYDNWNAFERYRMNLEFAQSLFIHRSFHLEVSQLTSFYAIHVVSR